MACFLVPTAEAVAVKVIERVQNKKEKKRELKIDAGAGETARTHVHVENTIPFSRKLRWLTRLLIGGAVLLAFEHIWHGEVVPWFPFLTAAATPGTTSVMLHEMATTGVGMAVLVTAVWAVMCKVADRDVRRMVERREN